MAKLTDAEKRAKKRAKSQKAKLTEMAKAVETVSSMGMSRDKAAVELVERIHETLDGAALSANVGDLLTYQITDNLCKSGMSADDDVIKNMYKDLNRFKDLSLRLNTVPVAIAEKYA